MEKRTKKAEWSDFRRRLMDFSAELFVATGFVCIVMIYVRQRIFAAFQIAEAFTGKKNGANDRIRTGDLFITSELLYQLSHIGTLFS